MGKSTENRVNASKCALLPGVGAVQRPVLSLANSACIIPLLEQKANWLLLKCTKSFSFFLKKSNPENHQSALRLCESLSF